MATYQEDETGTLVTGHFYQILGWNPVKRLTEDDSWVISRHEDQDSVMRATLLRSTKEDVHDCPRSKVHVSGRQLTAVEVNLFSGMLLPAIGDSDGFSFFIDKELRNRLKTSKLRGTDFIRVTVGAIDGEPRRAPELYLPIFPGKNAKRPHAVFPSEANKCPFCGKAPAFCPWCGEEEFKKCPNCDKYASVWLNSREPEDRRILKMPAAELGHVIDGTRWDGNDLFGGKNQYITRRALDFLLSIHAAPFRARPLRTYVGGCTVEQLKNLESAKQPVP
jgi:hypothetical protein